MRNIKCSFYPRSFESFLLYFRSYKIRIMPIIQSIFQWISKYAHVKRLFRRPHNFSYIKHAEGGTQKRNKKNTLHNRNTLLKRKAKTSHFTWSKHFLKKTDNQDSIHCLRMTLLARNLAYANAQYIDRNQDSIPISFAFDSIYSKNWMTITVGWSIHLSLWMRQLNRMNHTEERDFKALSTEYHKKDFGLFFSLSTEIRLFNLLLLSFFCCAASWTFEWLTSFTLIRYNRSTDFL